jgi:hypothetical protein
MDCDQAAFGFPPVGKMWVSWTNYETIKFLRLVGNFDHFAIKYRFDYEYLTVPSNPHWARVVDYGPFSLCVIHKEGLCPSSGDINRLMMMI